MHPSQLVREALRLHGQGLTAVDIGRRLAVPRRTIADWVGGKYPRKWATTASAAHCTACGQPAHDATALPREYVYLLGAYLGDGCISRHPRGVFRLRVVLDARYPRIIEEVRRAVATVMPANTAGLLMRRATDAVGAVYLSCVEVYSYSRAWPCLFPQHGPGRKHERTIELADWQQALVTDHPELLIRGLIHSDGCRSINHGKGSWRIPRYSFSNVSDDIRGIFIAACEQIGLHTTTAPRTVYVSRKADVARMDEFVGPKA